MSTVEQSMGRGDRGIVLPSDLQKRLESFRGLVWKIKVAEAVCGALFGLMLAYLLQFGLDRLMETPQWVRFALFAGSIGVCTVVPLAVHRWIWNHRRLDQVARLIARRFPSMGDQLLGIIEIVREFAAGPGVGEQGRSRALCEAAIGQVAAQSQRYDFSQAVPHARHRLWAMIAAVPVVLALVAAALVPAAASNAWARLLAPWKAVERFTFTRVDKLPQELVVPIGEPAPLTVGLASDTQWKPDGATAKLGRQRPLTAPRGEDGYAFTLPPQLDGTTLSLAVGDARSRTKIVPMLRPEIETVVAEVKLPAYLKRSDAVRQDVRGGSLSPVEGSTVTLAATATRELAGATVDGAEVTPDGATIRTGAISAKDESKVSLEWRDRHGLQGSKPLVLLVSPRKDDAPTVTTLDVPANRDYLLSSDTLRFKVAVRDDFGIRRVGIEWEGTADDGSAPEKGDRVLQNGGPMVDALNDVAATFCPDALGIRPQPLVVRAFAEDYLPGRGRVYSAPMLVYVVDKAEHALLLHAQLGQVRADITEVKDKEQELFTENVGLQLKPADSLLTPEGKKELEDHARAEQDQADRLDAAVEKGADLVREAGKNPDFDPDTLRQLAEDLKTLSDLSKKRMPSVKDLLTQVARAKVASAQGAPPANQLAGEPGKGEPGKGEPGDGSGSSPQGPKVGQNKNQQAGGEGGQKGPPPDGVVPSVIDGEPSQQPQDPNDKGAGSGGGKSPAPRLELPTTLAGVPPARAGGGDDSGAEEPPADATLDAAIEAQRQLLEEFAKVADDLSKVMANLEGSTFVRRLKLLSRRELAIAGGLAATKPAGFGKGGHHLADVAKHVRAVAEAHGREALTLSNIMDDMQAYFDRRQLPAFRSVLEEMKSLDALGGLRALTDDIRKEPGMSLAQAEFWSDVFDRLADDLVPPPPGGPPGPRGPVDGVPPSVPPDIVLETMRILEAEVNLREETRVAEQNRKAVGAEEFAATGRKLGKAQDALADRVVRMVDRLLDEENGASAFAREIQLFEKVEEVMAEAADILRQPDTGKQAIAAETEVIELLLEAQTPPAGPGSPGAPGAPGPGATPGAGSTGSTNALADILRGAGNATQGNSGNRGNGEKDAATGTAGRDLPAEYRDGLDRYFNEVERQRR